MENNFNATLKALRKSKGITQEQLAEAVGVSAQAVSKWEMNSFPDPSLLPAIADYLEVTIDELFGRKKEEPDIMVRIMRHIRNQPNGTHLQAAMDICRAIIIRLCSVDSYDYDRFDPVPESVYRDQDKERGIFSEVKTEHGFIQARIPENLQYFLLMPEPEEGYDYVLDYKEKYVDLFKFLALPNALRAMYFLTGCDNSMFFTAETIVKELGISRENAEEIIKGMNELGFLWNADFNTGNSSERIYHYTPGVSFVAFITFTHFLLHRPYHYNYQNNSRPKEIFFKNDTYKYTPKTDPKE